MTDAYLRKELARLRGAIEDSRIFLALMSKDYLNDVGVLLQLGLAVALDKPIYLIVPRGTVLPENARRLARGIEEYSGLEDIEFAVSRLLARAEAENR